MNLDSGYLFAAVIWGAVGSGYFIYGWKQRRHPALVGGLALMGITYFMGSALWMSVTAIALMAGIYFWAKQAD